MSTLRHNILATYAATHSANFAEVTSSQTAEIEVLRSSYDIDGVKVELTYDSGRRRYSIATRWAYLAHFSIPNDTLRWRRVGIERAGAVFEAVCQQGATKVVALVAKRHALALDPAHCINRVGYEKEILRRTRNSLEPQASQQPLLS